MSMSDKKSGISVMEPRPFLAAHPSRKASTGVGAVSPPVAKPSGTPSLTSPERVSPILEAVSAFNGPEQTPIWRVWERPVPKKRKRRAFDNKKKKGKEGKSEEATPEELDWIVVEEPYEPPIKIFKPPPGKEDENGKKGTSDVVESHGLEG
ncbi:MAG: hypothetical protein M1824_003118 [Vezdaea acicularis]|nr:MAG: hypothetical protein M1824_003118 [Vezdaea acicularis]